MPVPCSGWEGPCSFAPFPANEIIRARRYLLAIGNGQEGTDLVSDFL